MVTTIDVNEIIKKDLGEEKYQKFMDFIKDEFINDTIYLKIKDNISENGSYKETILFYFYFKYISYKSTDDLINSKQNYQKLYWHIYRRNKLLSKSFKYISKKFVPKLVDLSIETIKLSLEQKRISFFSDLDGLFKDLKVYDATNLKPLIEYIKTIDTKYWIVIEKHQKEDLLNVLALECENYEYIKSLYFQDSLDEYNYFKALFSIDINKAFDDFIEIIYPRSEKYIKFTIEGKVEYIRKYIRPNKYDNIGIDSRYRTKFETLMSLLYSLSERRKFDTSKLSIKIIEFILVNYFEFYKEYHHPIGSYSPGIYDNMNELINQMHTPVTFGHSAGVVSYIQPEIIRTPSRFSFGQF